jgi:DNA invertase Pin-like site-specific DNA recombinase
MEPDDGRAAVWIRVSTDQQDATNQLDDIEQFAAHHGYLIVERYQVSESAWNGGSSGYKSTLKRAMDAAYAGRFSALIVWSIDRVSRGGAEDVLKLVRQLRERRCSLVSVREPWLSGSPEVQDLLLSFAGWMAQRESARRSERVKAAIARKKADGSWTGRGKDRGTRRKSGYFAREARKRELGVER